MTRLAWVISLRIIGGKESVLSYILCLGSDYRVHTITEYMLSRNTCPQSISLEPWGWESVVQILCRLFELPGIFQALNVTYALKSRDSGLKRIHANFPIIQKRLEAAYTKYAGNEKVMGGIAGI